MAIVGAVGGCACPERGPGERSVSHTRSVLAAARARQISFFGDLGTDDERAPAMRSAISLKRHTSTEIGEDTDVTLDPTGQLMVFASTRHSVQPNLYLKSVAGVAVTQLTGDPASDVEPAFSPDGSRVAFASDRSGNWDIWMTHLNGGPPVQLTDGAADDVHPSWSPDGRSLVYCSRPAQGGAWELWIAEVDGRSTKKFIGYGLFPQWSPTGDRILFQRARERGSRIFGIWTVTLVDGEPRYPTEVASSPRQAFILPTWSRDGERIAFTCVAESMEGDPAGASPRPYQQFDVWMMSADGSGRVRLTDGHSANFAPAFAADGRLFFTSDRGGQENIWSLFPVGAHYGPMDDSVTERSSGANTLARNDDPARRTVGSYADGLWDVRNSALSHTRTSAK